MLLFLGLLLQSSYKVFDVSDSKTADYDENIGFILLIELLLGLKKKKEKASE